MIMYGNAARSFGRYGRFAGGGRSIFGPYSFAESWSSDDFATDTHFNKWVKPYLDQVPSAVGMTYSPPSTSLITNASAKFQAWQEASDSGVPGAAEYVAKIDSSMKNLITRADQLSLTVKGWPFVGSREETIEVQRYKVFQDIVKQMKLLAASKPPVAVMESVVTGGDTGPAETTYVKKTTSSSSAPPSGYMQGQSGAALVGQSTGGWIFPAAIAGGVLVMGGLAFALTRKKPASMAGYRRRSSRSRRSR